MNRRILASLVSALLVTGCGSQLDLDSEAVEQLDAGVAISWMALLQKVVKEEGLPPTSGSRTIVYLSIALYEGCIVGDPTYRSLAGQLNDLPTLPAPSPLPSGATPYDSAAVANRAAAVVMRGLLPGMFLPTSTTGPFAIQAINGTEQGWNARRQNAVPMDVWQRSFDHGDALGAAIVAWANNDGFAAVNAAQATYVPPIGPGLWIPTPAGLRRALHPLWGTLRTFVVADGDEFAPPAPPVFSSDPASAFHAEEREVYDIVNNLTAEEEEIAKWWADDPVATCTPPCHWVNIVSQICARDNLPQALTAEAYVRVGLAVGDGFITCWQAKYAHNQIRPVTYIREWIDGDWMPLLETPPFPDYISGHGTQSAASAAVLTDLFGVMSFVDTTHVNRGLHERFYSSFADAAAEAALSRLLGGIHIRSSNDTALLVGDAVGQAIIARVQFRN